MKSISTRLLHLSLNSYLQLVWLLFPRLCTTAAIYEKEDLLKSSLKKLVLVAFVHVENVLLEKIKQEKVLYQLQMRIVLLAETEFWREGKKMHH